MRTLNNNRKEGAKLRNRRDKETSSNYQLSVKSRVVSNTIVLSHVVTNESAPSDDCEQIERIKMPLVKCVGAWAIV